MQITEGVVRLVSFLKKHSGQKSPQSIYPKELKRYARRDARVIPEHGIQQNTISYNALKVVRTLQANGQIAYLVGGCVRDLLIGRRPKDFDVVTDATPQRIKEIFRYARIIGRRFRIVHIPFGREIIETATFRALPADDSGEEMLQRDNIYGTEREDAYRRDITINALFYDPVRGVIIDYVDGYRDIERRIIRMVRDPYKSYAEDPVRMIRALKYQATTGFQIERSGLEPIQKMAGLISACSTARVMEEIFKILRSGVACAITDSLCRTGLLPHLAPAVTDSLAQGGDFASSGLAARLSALDRLTISGRNYSNAVLLAVLLADAINADSSLIEPISKGMHFSRLNKDQVLRIFSAQPRFAHPEKKNRAALLAMGRKDWFRDALDFYEISCHAQDKAECSAGDSAKVALWREIIENIPQPEANALRTQRGGVRIRRKGESAEQPQWKKHPHTRDTRQTQSEENDAAHPDSGAQKTHRKRKPRNRRRSAPRNETQD
ncbi:MAG: polynucleotide adenylyltransferase PcnB [Spirochaetota bacterium]|nr:polynucleotide adenylyltransferase PcnB [Spirochaetota bacterium]